MFGRFVGCVVNLSLATASIALPAISVTVLLGFYCAIWHVQSI